MASSGLRLGFDSHGNPESKVFDLGGMDDDRVRGEKILFYICYQGWTWNEEELKGAVAERGFQMDIRYAPAGHCDLDERLLAQYPQLWYLSTDTPSLDRSHIKMIADYVRRGNGLAIWADNDPYYADANLLAREIVGSSFSGNVPGQDIMTPADLLAPGYFIEHPLTQGVNNLYEGSTICTIAPAPDVTILGQSHDRQMCLGCFERDQQRVVLDTGFTKLYSEYFNKTAGTARYLRNIAFWLARGSRGVEYHLMTQARQGMTTIATGQTSQPYTQTVKEPAEITYTLQWEGGATLGLMVRDPQGRTVYDQSSATAPLRATLPATIAGDWVGVVKGVSVSGKSAPYVLALSLDHTRALSLAPVASVSAPASDTEAPQPFLPVCLVVDTSSAASGVAPALSDGIAQLAAQLRARARQQVGVRLEVVGTGGSGQALAPLAAPDPGALPRLTGQGSSQLGAALRTLLGDLPLRTARMKPLIIVLLAGAPADNWTSHADQLHTLASNLAARVFVLGLNGYADPTALRRLTPTSALSAPNLTPDRVKEVFAWIYTLADWAMSQQEGGKAPAPQPQPPAWMNAVR